MTQPPSNPSRSPAVAAADASRALDASRTGDASLSLDAGPSWLEVAQSRRARRRRFGFATRLSIYCVTVALAGVAAAALWQAERGAVAARAEMAAVARAAADGLATLGAPATATRDLAALRAIAARAAETRGAEARRAVTFTDARGTVLASAGQLDADERADAIGALVPTRWLGQIAPLTDVGAVAPVVAGAGRTPVGYVALHVSGAGLARAQLRSAGVSALVGLCAVGGALLVAFTFVGQSFRPLVALSTTARRVIAGDLDAVVPARGGAAAVFDLAVAFNELVAWVRGERARLAQANLTLDATVRELERNCANRGAQVEAANARLQAEIAEKEDFLRAVSHDLNAPLRNIGGMVAMLMMKDRATLSPEAVGRLERIKRNVDVETDLINELLELSRIKTRRQQLERVDTESVLWDLRGLFENDLKTRGIELVVETSLPALFAERARVRQIFLNLVDNAVKYMGDDKPRKEIRVGCRLDAAEAEFYVRDTGLGIHPEDLDKVFFVFRRGRGEVAQKVPGKGVGLASVKSIIETYAGRIRVQSALGEGTTFLFTINGKYVPSLSGNVMPTPAGGDDADDGGGEVDVSARAAARSRAA